MRVSAFWTRVAPRLLPFADAASAELPLARLLRLSLFQLSCGLCAVLLTGTLNRVMIVELGLPAGIVALMVALPLLFAPARALIGHASDHHRSFLGWKRVPYIWFGTLMQFGGLAIMPFALLVMTGGGEGPAFIGEVAAALAFLLAGAGMHMTQTAGLALATDLAPEDRRPRVVALLYVMLLVGMLVASLLIGQMLLDFSPTRLVGVVQGAALATMLLNLVALWRQEARNPQATRHDRVRPAFGAAWGALLAERGMRRLLVAVGLGSAAFAMQDVLLEPYGAEVLGMGVGETTRLTALWAAGTLVALIVAARQLARGIDPHRIAATGVLAGIPAFAAVILSAPTGLVGLLAVGILGIGFGGGLFGVGLLTAAMAIGSRRPAMAGLALGAWGAVQASAAGLALIAAGLIRDGVGALAAAGALGRAMSGPDAAYTVVWHLEIALLFATLVALGPLVRRANPVPDGAARPFGLREFPA